MDMHSLCKIKKKQNFTVPNVSNICHVVVVWSHYSRIPRDTLKKTKVSTQFNHARNWLYHQWQIKRHRSSFYSTIIVTASTHHFLRLVESRTVNRLVESEILTASTRLLQVSGDAKVISDGFEKIGLNFVSLIRELGKKSLSFQSFHFYLGTQQAFRLILRGRCYFFSQN